MCTPALTGETEFGVTKWNAMDTDSKQVSFKTDATVNCMLYVFTSSSGKYKTSGSEFLLKLRAGNDTGYTEIDVKFYGIFMPCFLNLNTGALFYDLPYIPHNGMLPTSSRPLFIQLRFQLIGVWYQNILVYAINEDKSAWRPSAINQ